MKTNRPLAPETLAAQALGFIDPENGAVVPPIHTATTYERPPGGIVGPGYNYTRTDNPTYAQVESLLARLEGGAEAMVLASGMSAVTAPFLALSPGDHVVVQDVLYWGVRAWLNDFATHWGLRVQYVEAGDLDALARAVAALSTLALDPERRISEAEANPVMVLADGVMAVDALVRFA